jgi:hypothetical protein
MLYMVIEQFKDAPAIYRRFREKGRMMPDGLSYISSWIDIDLKVCYQLMKTEDVGALPALDGKLGRSDGIQDCAGTDIRRNSSDS